MIFYEVNVSVAEAIRSDYEAWLPGHIRHVVRVGGFVDGAWWRAESLQESGGHADYVIRYAIGARSVLNDYLQHHANELRQDGQNRFGGQFVAWRRILEQPETL